MRRTLLGTAPGGGEVERLVLGLDPGPEVQLLTMGAGVHRLVVTGGDGVRRDVVLGHDTVAARVAAGEFQGAIVGRYANRIAGGDLPLPGVPGGRVALGTNDRGNHLHGGPDGFHLRSWVIEAQEEHTARLLLVSPDGDQGYPGRLELRATYTVLPDGLDLELVATTDRTTVVNPTSHVYLNLAGHGSATIDDHRLEVPAGRYTPVDDVGIPLGEHADVTGTPFDLRAAARLGDVVRTDDPQVRGGQGLDHNFVLDGEPDAEGLRTAAVLSCPATRTAMTLRTDRPGLQVYTGNFLDGTSVGLGGRLHRQGDGIALEPQLFPDSPHHPEWPSALVAPGETWRARITWLFSELPG